MTETATLANAPSATPAATTPRRDNRAASRRLRAELDARPPDASISELGRELRAIRQRYLDNGGTLLSDKETEKLVRLYRFGIEE